MVRKITVEQRIKQLKMLLYVCEASASEEVVDIVKGDLDYYEKETDGWNDGAEIRV